VRTAFALLITLTSVRCATVAHGRYQTVPVSSNPADAAVRATCGNDPAVDAGVTPATVRLRRGATCSLTLTKSGYRSETVSFRRARSGVFYANVVPGVVAGTVAGAGEAVGSLLATDSNNNAANGAFAAGFVLGTAIPMLIDHTTGAMYKQVPERVDVTLVPATP
jgi:hypothetical protein